MPFEPELGQALFSNTEWQEMDMAPDVERLLLVIGDQLAARGLVAENPCLNVGESYENDTFALRSYCWCDGVRVEKHWFSGEPWGHPDGCPPNFQWKDFACAWYKHVGRGNSQNRAIAATELAVMLGECLASIPASGDANA